MKITYVEDRLDLFEVDFYSKGNSEVVLPEGKCVIYFLRKNLEGVWYIKDCRASKSESIFSDLDMLINYYQPHKNSLDSKIIFYYKDFQKDESFQGCINWYVDKLNKTDSLTRFDEVTKPEHYNTGDIECIDAIKASMSKEEFKGYLKGNTLKYLWRYRYKDKPVQDLNKALWYLNKLLKENEVA